MWIIYNNTFENCISLKTIEFPENVSYVNKYSFRDCISL